MKVWKKALSVGLSLAMCAGLVAPSFAAVALKKDTHIDGYGYLLPHEEMDEAGEVFQSYDYYLDQDIELKRTLLIKKGVKASIDLNGHDLMLNDTVGAWHKDGYLSSVTVSDKQGTKKGSVIEVGVGAELTIDDSTATGSAEDGTYVSGKITGGTGTLEGRYDSYGGGIWNNGTLTMNGGTISGNTASRGGGVYSPGTFNMKGGAISGNMATQSGGGVFSVLRSFTMEGGAISGNTATWGGGVLASTSTMKGGAISGNMATLGGGGVYTDDYSTFTMESGTISGNMATQSGGGVANYGTFIMSGGAISGNTNKEGESNIYSYSGRTLGGTARWFTADGEEYFPGEDGKVPETVTLNAVVPPAEDDDDNTSNGTGTSSYTPAEAETQIDDVAVPLAAGPVTRAEFIDYLWRHEGEPETDGICTFTDVPADHEFILALAWAEQTGVAKAYFDADGHEDGTFEPDELVTVAAVREFLGNFARVFEMDVDVYALITLTGEDDEAVLNCDEVLAEFFGEELAAAA